MPEGTGPLRDLHPQILRRGPRAGIQFAAGEAPSLRAKDTKVGCACLKVITMAGSPARRWTGRSAGCWPISRRRSAKPAKPSSPASATRAGLSLRAGYDNGGFSGATTDRPALQRLLAEITAARAPAIRSAASSPTSSPAVRYWNRARQRYHRLSARYSRARVSLPTQAARPGPDNRGKPRLLDLERRIPARDRFAPDSSLEGSGFEISVPRYLW